jgi:hypothetical protein
MAKTDDMKIRLIAVYRMIESGQQLTAGKILRRLDAQYGITADRKTIYDDLRAIDRFIPLDIRGGVGGGVQKYDIRNLFR